MSVLATALYVGPAALLYLGAGAVLLADLVQGRRAATGALTLLTLVVAAVSVYVHSVLPLPVM